MKNIVKIIIFVVAIVACLLAVWFATSFDQDKLDKYSEAQAVNNANPEMIAAFSATTPESLPAFVDQYRSEGVTLAEGLKAQQLQKDILYTYIVELQELTAETFPEYQANFANHSKALFAKADNPQEYVDGFNAVADFDGLAKYINTLEDKYNVLKQDFIQQKAYVKAYNSIVNQADAVNQTVSENKKAEDLATLQSDMKQYLHNGKLLNVILIMTYVLFIINIALLLIFALKAIVTNIRSSYKILVVIALFAVIIILGYVFASSEMTPSAIKMQLTPQTVRRIGMGMFVLYVMFFGAIFAVIYSAISNAIKNRK
jgi:magnesium-transporting ATPase (P-type)